MRSLVRGVIVVALVVVELGVMLPDIIRPLRPLGDLGFSTITDVVTGLVPNGSATKAHIDVGDAIVFPTPDVRFRWFDSSGVSFPLARPGDTAPPLTVYRGSARRQIVLTAGTYTEYPDWLATLRVLLETGWVLLAAFLVLRVPSITTWSFFALSIFPNIAPMALGPLILPLPFIVLHHTLYQLGFSVLAQPAAIAFVLSLGARPLPRWRGVAAWVLIPLFTLLNLPILIQNFLWYFGGIAHSVFDFSTTAAYGAVSLLWGLVVLVLLGVIYTEDRSQNRARIGWVLAGFVVYCTANTAVAFLPSSTPLAVLAVLWTSYAVLPICVTYAILRHRLVDINFFISRALVYGIISGLVIAILGLVDWLFSKNLSMEKIGVYAQVVAAVAIGFWLRDLHHRVDHFVDSVFFRRKHRAEQHLLHLARALPYATTHSTLNQGLVDEPFAALRLASAAFFEKREAEFRRVHACGSSEQMPSALDGSDVALLDLKTDADASVINEPFWAKHGLTATAARPDVALPITVRGELVAIALYGAHKRGEHLDDDELRTLAELAAEAAIGYAHLQASSLRRASESARREAEVAMMQTELLRRENSVLRQAPLGNPS